MATKKTAAAADASAPGDTAADASVTGDPAVADTAVTEAGADTAVTEAGADTGAGAGADTATVDAAGAAASVVDGPAMYEVVSPLEHDGRHYDIGSQVGLDEEHAQRLLGHTVKAIA